MHRLGVRSSLLLNKFDNPLTGVRFDCGRGRACSSTPATGRAPGSFWSARDLHGPAHDNEIASARAAGQRGARRACSARLGVPGGTLPAYPPAPHCNTRGLTELGRHVVRRMMDLRHGSSTPTT